MNQGRAAQIATPMEIFNTPADTYVASFIGSPTMNLLRATLTEGGSGATLAAGGGVRFAQPVPGPAGHPVLVGIRPEHVMPGGDLPVAIELVEPLGSETVLHGTLPSGEAMTVRVQGAAPVTGGAMPVSLAHHLHVFDAESGRRL
jgi:sn-glycerol 3-phosphate transport system ATP-binding protein